MRMIPAVVVALGIVAAAFGQTTTTKPATGPASRAAAEAVSDEAVKKYAEAVVIDRKSRQEGLQEKIANSKVFIAQAEAGKITGFNSVTPGQKPVYVFKDAANKATMIRELKVDLARFEEDAKPVDRPWTVDEPVNMHAPTKQGDLASFPKPFQLLEIHEKDVLVSAYWVKASKDKRSQQYNMEPRLIRGLTFKDAKPMDTRPIPGIFVAVGTEKISRSPLPPVALVVEPVDAKTITPRINAAIKAIVKPDAGSRK